MSYIGKTRDHLTDLMGKAITNGTGTDSAQTVTIGRPRAEVEQFWRDPENLSQVLADIASIRSTGHDIREWTVHRGSEEAITWESTLLDEEGP